MENEKYIYKSKLPWFGYILLFSFTSFLFFFSPNAYFLFPIGVIIIWFFLYKVVFGKFYENSFTLYRPFSFINRKMEFLYSEVDKMSINGNVGPDRPSFSIYIKAKKVKKYILVFNYEDSFIPFLKHLKDKGTLIISTDHTAKNIYKDYISSSNKK